MTRPIDTLLTLFKTFVHTTVNTTIIAAGGSEQLAANPTIVLDNDFVDGGAVNDTNGYIVLMDEQEANPQENGVSRHLIYYVNGIIMYDSGTDKNSLVIKTIYDHLRSLMNVNNAGGATTTYRFRDSKYNNSPKNGTIAFVVEVRIHGVTALT